VTNVTIGATGGERDSEEEELEKKKGVVVNLLCGGGISGREK